MKQFKSDLLLIYRQALIHYKGNKVKSSACVQAYCQGLNDKDLIAGKEKKNETSRKEILENFDSGRR